MLGVLLKKQLCEKLSYFRRDKKNIDYVGAILTLALLALMLFVIVEVFGAFVEKYTAIRMYGVADVRARQFEIMTLVYESVFLIGIISGVSMINRALFESDDRQILITLPVKASTVFLSKVISASGEIVTEIDLKNESRDNDEIIDAYYDCEKAENE